MRFREVNGKERRWEATEKGRNGRNEQKSREGESVGLVADAYRIDPANRHSGDASVFLITIFILDIDGVHGLRVYVDDSHAATGIMLIVLILHDPPRHA